MVSFFVPGERESVIDVTYSRRADIEETLRTSVWVEDAGLDYRIPTLEAALANKYGAMRTFNHDPAKRAIDAVDTAHMVRHSADEGRELIDEEWLTESGEKVWPGGGRAEILCLVGQARSSQEPTLGPQRGRPG